jgi:N-acetylglucosamine-6-phosphate deacetylase
MPPVLLAPDAAVLDGRLVTEPLVLVEGGTVRAVGGEVAGARRRIRGTLLPGLVDLQVNGAGGHGVDEGTPEALDAIARAVLAGGAAAFLPTLITAAFERLLDRIAAVARWLDARPRAGAVPLGIHVEGPFLEVPGAHDEGLFVDPTPERVDALLAAGNGHVRLVTLAPARAGAAAAVARLRAAGVTVALGHARSTDGFTACVDAGAMLVTHLFNAMGPLHHREAGVAWLALDGERLSCSLILDGAHVHPIVARNAFRCLGAARTVLVTDAVAAAGMPDGDYRLSGIPVRSHGGVVRDAEGRLAGSALTMARAARAFLDTVPTAGAVELARVASYNPARLVDADGFGEVRVGGVARFALLLPDREVTAFVPDSSG